MRQRSNRQSELLWARAVMRESRKISAGDSEHIAETDEDYEMDFESDTEDYDKKGAESQFKKDYANNTVPMIRRKSETSRVQYINTTELKVYVGTWNVGGKLPPDDLVIDDWLGINQSADIYVLGFQEILPLNANIFGTEDSRPVPKWNNIIGKTLNRIKSPKGKFESYSDPPHLFRFKPSEDIPNILEETPIEPDGDDDEDMHPVDEEPRSLEKAQTTISGSNNGCSISSKNVTTEPNLQNYVRIISKQMDGIFLTIWVRDILRRHIQNVRVSTVDIEATGCIGNRGSIAVSMSIYQTLLCFICTHLTPGEKEGDELKRNADVLEIHRRTIFRSVSEIQLPKSIFHHEKIIWFGDLNYRLNLSYEKTRELISKREWSQLFERDQLSRELRKGRIFDGWSEDVLNFPPTYKYEFNSEKYYGEDLSVGRRIYFRCDRTLSYGKGMKQLNYRRAEMKLSDHRAVSAMYMVEIYHKETTATSFRMTLQFYHVMKIARSKE